MSDTNHIKIRARLAFGQNLFEPQKMDNGDEKYNCTLLFPKGDGELKKLEASAVAAATEKWGDKAKDMIANGAIKSPFLDGDGAQAVSKKTGERHAGFAGCKFIRPGSGVKFPPRLIDRGLNPIMDQSELPSGSWVFALVNAFCWENKNQGKGISFGVSVVQLETKAKGDEVLGGTGGPSVGDYFEAIPDDGEDTSAATADNGAAGLFG